MSFVGAMIGLMIAVIVGVSVAIPVVSDSIANSSATGTTKTLLNLIPMVIGLALFVGAIAMVKA